MHLEQAEGDERLAYYSEYSIVNSEIEFQGELKSPSHRRGALASERKSGEDKPSEIR